MAILNHGIPNMHGNKKSMNIKYCTYELANIKIFGIEKVDVVVINISVFLNFMQNSLQVLTFKTEN